VVVGQDLIGPAVGGGRQAGDLADRGPVVQPAERQPGGGDVSGRVCAAEHFLGDAL
jgi:hypothetical protein